MDRRDFLQSISGIATVGIGTTYTEPTSATNETAKDPSSSRNSRRKAKTTQTNSVGDLDGPYATTGWSKDYVFDEISGSPTITDDFVIIGEQTDYVLNIGKVRAYDKETGAHKWATNRNSETNTRLGFPQHSPVASNGQLFFSGARHPQGDRNYGGIYALNAQNGAMEWFRGDIVHPRTLDVVNNRVYVGSHALDTSTGQTIWKGEQKEQLLGVANGIVFTQLLEERGEQPTTQLIARNAMDGAQQWNVSVSGSRFDATVTAKTLYITKSEQPFSVAAYSTTDGSKQWETTVRTRGETGNPYVSAPTVDESRVYVNTSSSHAALLDYADHPINRGGTVYALNRNTGAEQWRFETPAQVDAAPTIVGNTVYIPARYYSCPDTTPSPIAPPENVIYALKSATGTECWSYAVDAGAIGLPPVISNEKLYFAVSGSGDLVSGWFGMLESTDCQPSCKHQVADDGKTRTIRKSDEC